MDKAQIRIGIGGWTYPPWRGTFYPSDLVQSKELEFAANSFGAIEINATFYGRQSPKSRAAWAAAVPDGFRFMINGAKLRAPAAALAMQPKLCVYFALNYNDWNGVAMRA